jgi:exosortase family protein XrtF
VYLPGKGEKKMSLFQEFKPALLFLGKFLAIYLVGNILYGLFVELYDKAPDPVTRQVSVQTAWILTALGTETTAVDHTNDPKVALICGADVVLNVFEGCNGINVMIVFVAFLFSFGGNRKALLFFIPAGLLLIHIFNLVRILLLFNLATEQSRHFYYFHKYFFTAFLYVVVLALWAVWVMRFSDKSRSNAPA